jgi:hypothetical protein
MVVVLRVNREQVNNNLKTTTKNFTIMKWYFWVLLFVAVGGLGFGIYKMAKKPASTVAKV